MYGIYMIKVLYKFGMIIIMLEICVLHYDNTSLQYTANVNGCKH